MASMRREAPVLFTGDAAILVASLWLALFARSLEVPTFSYFLEHLVAFIPVFAVSIGIFFIAGLYEKQTRLIRSFMASRIVGAQLVGILVAVVCFFFLPLDIAPKTVLALYLVISVVLVSVWRFATIPRFAVGNRTSAVLVGSGPAVNELLEEVNGNDRYFIRFTEHFDTKAGEPLLERIRGAVERGARSVVIDTRDREAKEVLPLLYDLMLKQVSFSEFSTVYEDVFDRVPLAHIDYAWLLACLPRRHRSYDISKRLFDIVLGAIAIIVALPFVLVATLVLLVTGGHPFIFSVRIGKGGAPIRLMKLRTKLFYDNGDPEKQKRNRETVFGVFLRRTRIDELPQLWNVLAGDLSFIGPRPELPSIATIYKEQVPYYDARHLITPGLSGWAQIRDYDAPRGAADVVRTEKKVSYDLYYLKRRSFVVDLVIALKTLRALAALSGR